MKNFLLKLYFALSLKLAPLDAKEALPNLGSLVKKVNG